MVREVRQGAWLAFALVVLSIAAMAALSYGAAKAEAQPTSRSGQVVSVEEPASDEAGTGSAAVSGSSTNAASESRADEVGLADAPSDATGGDDSESGGANGEVPARDGSDNVSLDSAMVRSSIDYRIEFDPNGGVGDMPSLHVTLVEGADVSSALPSSSFTREGWRFEGWRTTVPSQDSALKPTIVPDGQELVNLSYPAVDDTGEMGVVGLVGYSENDVIVLVAAWRNIRTGELDDGMPQSMAGGMLRTSSTTVKYVHRSVNSIGNAVLSVDSNPANTFIVVPASSATPVYYMNNPYNTAQWLYTPFVSEYNNLAQAGWTKRGLLFYSDDAKGIPLYRFYYYTGTGAHDWTLSSSKPGWRAETAGIFGIKYYNVAYAGNGATSGSMATQRHQYGIQYTLASNAYARIGYRFNGWRGSNGVSYSNAQRVSNMTASSNATVTLSAQWVPNAYSVSFDPNGGYGRMANQAFTYGIAQQLKPCTFTRPGCKFAGWGLGADTDDVTFSDGGMASNLTAEHGVNVTLYARWQPLQLTVGVPEEAHMAMRPDGALLTPSADALRFENSGEAALQATGLRFIAGDGMSVVSEPHGQNEISLSLNAEGFEPVDLALFQGDGYRDVGQPGWGYVGANEQAAFARLEGACASAGEITEHGTEIGSISWKLTMPVICVRFKCNGAAGEEFEQRVNAGHRFKVAENPFSLQGRTFVCWNTESDGSGESFRPGDSVEFDADSDLYAQWV